MTSYKSITIYITIMSEVEGFTDCELERVVQKMQQGGVARVINDDGSETLIRVKKIDEGRCGSDEFCY